MSSRLHKPNRLLELSPWLASGFLLIAASILLPNRAEAATISCSVFKDNPGYSGIVNIFGSVTYSIPAPATLNVSAATPVGTVLSTARANPSQGGNIASCLGPVGSTYSYSMAGTIQRFTGSTGIANVYATNIPGIGIRVSYPSVTGNYLSYSGSNSSSVGPPGPGEVIGTATLATVEWIKTSATVASGSITPGLVGTVTFNGTTIASITLTGTTNIDAPAPPTCSVNTNSTQMVNLGDYKARDFNGVGTMTPAKAFNIHFNCSGGTSGQSTKIYITMTDASVPSNRTNNLSLASGSIANGVAIRIQRNAGTTDVLFGADSDTIGNTNQWQAGTVAAGTSTFSVPLQARMVQTGTVTTGSVSAKATFTVAYN